MFLEEVFPTLLLGLYGIFATVVAPIMTLVLWRRNRRLTEAVARLEARLAARFDAGPQARPGAERRAGIPGTRESPPQGRQDAEAPGPLEQPPQDEAEAAAEGRQATAATEETAGAAPGRPDLEQAIGGRWAVWIGGIALALGGIFLVRYSIEAGLLGPGARIIAGALFAAALLAAGEFLRRRELTGRIAGVPSAHVPGILTAAGIVSAFATAFAAHALYGFLGPAVAFVTLAAVSLAALLAAMLHGPGLAALGILAAYATPLLVSREDPDALALVLHLVFVTAAAYGVTRLRQWGWLLMATTAGAVGWGLVAAMMAPAVDGWTIALYAAALFVLVAGFLVVSFHEATPIPRDSPIDTYALAALAGAALIALVGLHADDFRAASRLAAIFVLAGLMALARRHPAVAPATLIAVALAAAGYISWDTDGSLAGTLGTLRPGPAGTPDLRPTARVEFLGIGSLLGLAFLCAGLWVCGRAAAAAPRLAAWFGAAAAAGPLLLLLAAWLRVESFERSTPFALTALLLATVLGAATHRLLRHELAAAEGGGPAPAALAAGAVGALSAGISIGLEKGFLTIALALSAAGLAWIDTVRPLPVLRRLAALIGVAVLARVIYDPAIAGDHVGTTPIFNWILYGYGVPMLAFALAARLLRFGTDDVWVRIQELLAIVFAALLAALEVRHLMNDGNIFAPPPKLAEMGLQATVALAFSIGLSRIGERRGRDLYDKAAVIAGFLGLAIVAFGLVIATNPIVTGEPVGAGRIFNDLLPGYLLPAVAAAILALLARGPRPRAFRRAVGALALVLAFAYVSFMVRHGFHGADLFAGPTSQAELWTYSAAWLAIGVALLAAGIVFASVPLRLASGAVVALTVTKVFLFDMAALEGALRALSFIGLGIALVGIGLAYQRLLLRAGGDAQAGPASS